MTADLRVLSLGAGVQSSALLLMALDGEIDRPDCAIFADTGWEPAAVYRHLGWLRGRASDAGLPVHVVSAGNLRDHILEGLAGKSIRSIPLYVNGPNNREGRLRRNCTSNFKIDPIEHKIRDLLGYLPRQPWRREHEIESWQGISLDEVYRMKTNRNPRITNVYPLIEARMSRWDCLLWMRARGYPEPPKSACVGCPYHSDDYWREMRDQRPDEWADVIDFDARIRWGLHGVKSAAYLHRSLQPLAEVDLSTAQERGQLALFDDFTEECEGICGV